MKDTGFKSFFEGYFFGAPSKRREVNKLGDITLSIRKRQIQKYREINAQQIKQRKALLSGK